jgi:transposase
MTPTYRTEIIDHLGLVAGMCEELGIGETIDQAIPQAPFMRYVTIGQAVQAMILNGLGFVNQQLYLVPHFFQNKPIPRLIGPGIDARHLNDDTLGRALDSLYAYGVTELYSLIAVTAAKRLGLTPQMVHLDSTSFHVDGRYNHDEEPDAGVIHITRGYSRDHRPDLNQVILELIVEHQAGIPLLMKPLSGNQQDAPAFGEVINHHIDQLQATYGSAYVVADCALYSEENLEKLAQTQMKWITRAPATVKEVQAALSQADPQNMTPLKEGYRYQRLTSCYGGVDQRWALIYSEHRQGQAQRTLNKQWLKQSTQEVHAFKKLCRTSFACSADAQQALDQFERTLQTTDLREVVIRPVARYLKPGRPRAQASPGEVRYQIEGALVSSLVKRQARLIAPCCFILATNELDDTLLSDLDLLEGYKGQQQVERGFRFLKDPTFLAASLYLKKPERIMALLMVMTLCLLVYAALEHRIRQGLETHEARFPDQKGKRTATPTARWVFHYFVGIHLLYLPDRLYPIVINLNEEHQLLLRVLGGRYAWFYR